MNIDLSGSIEQAFRKAVERAGQLRQAGRNGEAAAVYREAARLSQQLAQYAVSPAEKARRNQRTKDLETLSEKVGSLAAASPPHVAEAPGSDTDGLQAQIDALVTRSEVTWNDIAGLSATKRAIQLAFGMAVARKPEGVIIDSVRNVLLYGPSGTGKTLLAAAVSNGLRATFFNVCVAKLLSKWFGESSRLISILYATARRREPAVIFIDELEALFPSRDSDTTGAERRVLSTLLTELSGVSTSGQSPTVFTIGATNAPWLMDAAAASRFSRRVYVPLPDCESRREVLEIHLHRKGHRLDFPIERLIDATEGFSGRDLANLAAEAVQQMIARANPDLADVAALGDSSVWRYQMTMQPVSWDDVAIVLPHIKPVTSPEAVKRFEAW